MWGRVRSKKAAAQAESDALEADYEFARQSLAAAVARAYFSTIEAAQQEANAQETLGLYEEYLKLTDVRKEQGHASDFELAQIKSRTAGAQDTLYTAQQAARRRPSAPSKSSPATIPPANSACAVPFPAQPRRRARRSARANPRTPARHHRRRAPLRRRVSSRERSPHRAPAALFAQRHRRLGTAQLDSVGVLEAVNWSLAAGVIAADLLRRRTQGRSRTSAPPSKKPPPPATSASRLRAFEDVEDALASDYYLRKREGALGEMVSTSADAVKLGREQLEQGQTDMFTILRLAGENLAAKIELTQDPRLPPPRTREPAPRPRRRFQRHRPASDRRELSNSTPLFLWRPLQHRH